jgi:hypothetical protein
VLPGGRIVSGELLVPADQLVEARMVLGEGLEADPLGSALDLNPGLGGKSSSGRVQLDHRPVRTCLWV